METFTIHDMLINSTDLNRILCSFGIKNISECESEQDILPEPKGTATLSASKMPRDILCNFRPLHSKVRCSFFFFLMYLFSCSNRVYSTRACTVRATALGIFRASVRITHMAQVLLKANVVRCM